MIQPEPDLDAIARHQPDAHAKLAVGPYADANLASKARQMQRAARPRTLASAVRWVRWAARLEAPVRLHDRGVAEDGTPRMTGEFLSYLQGSTLVGVACAVDEDGWYRTPYRCALLTLHGRDEVSDGAGMAHLVAAIAASDEDVPRVAALLGIRPAWVVRPAAEMALTRLWDLYAPFRAGRA